MLLTDLQYSEWYRKYNDNIYSTNSGEWWYKLTECGKEKLSVNSKMFLFILIFFSFSEAKEVFKKNLVDKWKFLWLIVQIVQLYFTVQCKWATRKWDLKRNFATSSLIYQIFL